MSNMHYLRYRTHHGLLDIEVEEVLVPDIQTNDPHLAESIARADLCPVCLGRDLCPEIAQQFLTISLFAEKTLSGEIYKVLRSLILGVLNLSSIISSPGVTKQ